MMPTPIIWQSGTRPPHACIALTLPTAARSFSTSLDNGAAAMSHQFDLVIRNGTVFDGTGAESRDADVAIRGGRIAEVGKIAGSGADEIEARGRIVTPGFVDLHTHYDAQVTWSSEITPSSWNGVTTAMIGNCGV